MSIRYNTASPGLNNAGLEGRALTGSPPDFVPTPWVRNPSWLALTTVSASESKFVGLHAIYPESNFLALSGAGAYTVDWGDGSATEDFAASVVAYHEYDYLDADLSGTNAPVTLDGTADTINRTAHGYVNGDQVSLYNITSTTGVNEAALYYVVSAATDSFKISTEVAGSAVNLVGDGTATLLPYKQVLVKVYPQAGQTFTQLNLHQKHNKTGLQAYDSGFLDIRIAGPDLTDIRIGVQTPGSNTQTIYFASLERIDLLSSDCRQLNRLLYNCYSFQKFENFVTSSAAATTMSVTFTDVGDLVTATAHGFRNGDSVIFTAINTTTGISTLTEYFVISATTDTFQVSTSYGGSAAALTTDGTGTAARGTSLTSMCSGCGSLQAVSLFNMSSVITVNDMFNSCRMLRQIPLFDTSAVIVMAAMFTACSLLTTVPLYNTTAVISMASMFASCNALTSVPLFNTASVTNMQSMFSGCSALPSVPLFNTASVTSMSNMFSNCFALTSVPLFNTTSVTTMQSMFSNCRALTTVPLFNTVSVTNMSSMFSTCNSLTTVPLFNTVSVTNMSSMFSNCNSLTSVPLFNTASVTNMNSMFSSCQLLTSVPLFNTASVTIMSGMFTGCTALTTIPLFNTASVTSMSGMFSNCRALTTVPLFNTVSVTNMSSMFSNCNSLTSVPLFNTASVTTFNSMFSECRSLASVPALNLGGVTSSSGYSSLFTSLASLSQIKATGIKFTFSVANCKLSAAALNEIYTNLATVTSQTITVSGNHGTNADDPTIATAKGWTVTG